jgi:hypothetical protein
MTIRIDSCAERDSAQICTSTALVQGWLGRSEDGTEDSTEPLPLFPFQ